MCRQVCLVSNCIALIITINIIIMHIFLHQTKHRYNFSIKSFMRYFQCKNKREKICKSQVHHILFNTTHEVKVPEWNECMRTPHTCPSIFTCGRAGVREGMAGKGETAGVREGREGRKDGRIGRKLDHYLASS